MSRMASDNLNLRRTRYAAVFLGLIVAFVVLTVWNINAGSVKIPVADIARILFTG